MNEVRNDYIYRSSAIMKKSPQIIQDEIFKKMSAAKKLEVGTSLWKLAADLAPEKFLFLYGRNRPKKIISKDNRDS